MNRQGTHFDHDVFYLLEDYKMEIGFEEGDVYTEEEFGDSFEDWLYKQGYVLFLDCASMESDANILIPDIIDYVPIKVCTQLEERLQMYLKNIYFFKVPFTGFTFENYLDASIPESFDYRESEKGEEIGRYYFLVDDFGEEIVN